MYRFALSDRFSLSNVFLPLLAPPVPLHPFTKTDVVQRRNPHQKTGARAVHRVSINGPLQTQCFHTEKSEDQMCSKSHKGRKFRWLHGKVNCQRFWYVGNVQLCDIILLQIHFFFFFCYHTFVVFCFPGEHRNNNNKPFSNGTCSSVFLHSSGVNPQLSLTYDYR